MLLNFVARLYLQKNSKIFKKYEKKDDDYNYKINKYNIKPNKKLYTSLLVNKIIHY